jgi:threonine dehydrogenase-like Zn-dependent dehydrogenase
LRNVLQDGWWKRTEKDRGKADVVHAKIGDRIVIDPQRRGRYERECKVVEVQGRNGTPPYIVRWAESGKLALYFPGRNAHVKQPENSR